MKPKRDACEAALTATASDVTDYDIAQYTLSRNRGGLTHPGASNHQGRGGTRPPQ